MKSEILDYKYRLDDFRLLYAKFIGDKPREVVTSLHFPDASSTFMGLLLPLDIAKEYITHLTEPNTRFEFTMHFSRLMR